MIKIYSSLLCVKGCFYTKTWTNNINEIRVLLQSGFDIHAEDSDVSDITFISNYNRIDSAIIVNKNLYYPSDTG